MRPIPARPRRVPPPPPPSFAAIDFETANTQRTSACAVGIVRVHRGVIVERWSSLIRPPTRYFQFTYVHGITWAHVWRAPTFEEVWPEMLEVLENGTDFLAAHNASFDRGVLEACCLAAGVAPPRRRFECTVQTARQTWGIYPTKLPLVTAQLGISLQHHDAASDAEACAEIVLRARAKRLAHYAR